MKNAFDVVRDFEKAVAEYTGAPYCVAVNSCTNALGLCFEYMRNVKGLYVVNLPKYSYVGVAAQAKRLGITPYFDDYEWQHAGYFHCLPWHERGVVDSARLFTSNMYIRTTFMCTSHHWSKHLSTEQGGCILHDDAEADAWFRKMRFDGRTEGVPVKEDNIEILGRHCYMSPSSAALGLTNLMHLPRHNEPLPEANYPDLSQLRAFK